MDSVHPKCSDMKSVLKLVPEIVYILFSILNLPNLVCILSFMCVSLWIRHVLSVQWPHGPSATVLGRAGLDSSQEENHIGDFLDGILAKLRMRSKEKSTHWRNDRHVCGQMKQLEEEQCSDAREYNMGRRKRACRDLASLAKSPQVLHSKC